MNGFYGHMTSNNLCNMTLLRLLVDQMDLNSELFWEDYSQNICITPNRAFEGQLKHIFPVNVLRSTWKHSEISMMERLEFMSSSRRRCILPRDLAHYLNIESLEGAYSRLEDSLKGGFLQVALNKWACCSGQTTLSEEWENTFRVLFAVGAEFGVLRNRETREQPDMTALELPRDESVVNLIRHFVRPYVWAEAEYHGGLIEARRTLKGFQYLISRLSHLGIKLKATPSCERFEIHFDKDYMLPYWTRWRPDSGIDPHTLSLYYDHELSTWILWNAMYEEYCGEFWASLEHPERTMPGTWVD